MKATAIGLAFALFCASGSAQVVKCLGTNGKITYSDVACPNTSSTANVNVSGGNITESQVRDSQSRFSKEQAANSGDSGNCQLLRSQDRQAFDSFTASPNSARWSTSFQALQNFAKLCHESDVCEIIRIHISGAQKRFSETNNNSIWGGHLNSVTALHAASCNGDGSVKKARNIENSQAAGTPIPNPRRSTGYETKDKFGTIVNSESCHWTKDAHGNDVQSAGCSR